MFTMHNIGTVPKFKMHNVGTVPTFKMHNIGTQIFFNLNLELEFGLYGKNKWPLAAFVFSFKPSRAHFPTPQPLLNHILLNVLLYWAYCMAILYKGMV